MAAKPEPAQVQRAIEIYLQHAYGDTLPVTVRSQLAILKSWKGDLLDAPVFAPDAHRPPTRYTMRLGNRGYPHMKIVIELSPDDSRFLFRVDAHDRHVCPPPKAPEYPSFRQLMEANQRLVDNVEGEWAKEGFPTFKTYLRDDLARRAAGGGAAAGPLN